MDKSNTVKCPECGAEINVNEIVSHQIEEQVRADYDKKVAKAEKKYKEQADALKEEKEKLEKNRKEIEKEIEKGVAEKVKTEQKKIEKELRKKIQEETTGRMETMEEELKEKSEKLKELNKTRAEIEKLKREKEEMESSMEAKYQKEFNENLKEERKKIQKAIEENSELKIAEKETVIKQLNNQLKEAQRKAEQGSMQVQGEVQEVGIEAWLAEQFPLDTIEEIKKGARGADCLHHVNTRTRSKCGTIYYESKRTKSFSETWIDKFKKDIQAKGADIGVLVTQAMPSEMDRAGFRKGIWICNYQEFKALCTVLRESVIQISNMRSSQENKGDKMGMLYDFLTGNEFRMQIEAIVEGFSQLKEDLDKEKRAMERIWKQREKQIEKVIHNTTHMYGSVKGIAGNAIKSVKQLELTEGIE